MVGVDHFTKMTHFIRLEERSTGKEVTKASLKEGLKLMCYLQQ